jgi:ribosomal protein RSM22 (predicted rRNA methylase)
MKVKLTCTACREKFLCKPVNTTIQNPIITVECPSCGHKYEGNVSAYAFAQADFQHFNERLGRAAFMITLMQNMSFVANDDKHGVKIRKYTARRWNTQHTK